MKFQKHNILNILFIVIVLIIIILGIFYLYNYIQNKNNINNNNNNNNNNDNNENFTILQSFFYGEPSPTGNYIPRPNIKYEFKNMQAVTSNNIGLYILDKNNNINYYSITNNKWVTLQINLDKPTITNPSYDNQSDNQILCKSDNGGYSIYASLSTIWIYVGSVNNINKTNCIYFMNLNMDGSISINTSLYCLPLPLLTSRIPITTGPTTTGPTTTGPTTTGPTTTRPTTTQPTTTQPTTTQPTTTRPTTTIAAPAAPAGQGIWIDSFGNQTTISNDTYSRRNFGGYNTGTTQINGKSYMYTNPSNYPVDAFGRVYNLILGPDNQHYYYVYLIAGFENFEQTPTLPLQPFDNIRLLAANQNVLFAIGCYDASTAYNMSKNAPPSSNDIGIYYYILNNGMPIIPTSGSLTDGWKSIGLPPFTFRSNITKIVVNDSNVFIYMSILDTVTLKYNNYIYLMLIVIQNNIITSGNWQLFSTTVKNTKPYGIQFNSLSVNNDIIYIIFYFIKKNNIT